MAKIIRGGPDHCIECGDPPTHETMEKLYSTTLDGEQEFIRTRYCAAHAPEGATPLPPERNGVAH